MTENKSKPSLEDQVDRLLTVMRQIAHADLRWDKKDLQQWAQRALEDEP